MERIEVHGFGQHTEFHRLQIFWTLGDDDDVCSVLTAQRFTQSSCRQHLVVDDQTVIIYQEDVDARFYIPVLESIIEQDDIYVLACLIILQVLDTSCPFCIYSHIDIREFLVHLERFVTYFRHGRTFVGKYITMTFSLIAT